jgi:hypothetical protein
MPDSVVHVDNVMRALPKAVQMYKGMISSLGDAPIDVERGRELLRQVVGQIRIVPRDGYLVAKRGLAIQPLSDVSIRGSGGRI